MIELDTMLGFSVFNRLVFLECKLDSILSSIFL